MLGKVTGRRKRLQMQSDVSSKSCEDLKREARDRTDVCHKPAIRQEIEQKEGDVLEVYRKGGDREISGEHKPVGNMSHSPTLCAAYV